MSKTPPPKTPPLPQSTPVRTQSNTTDTYRPRHEAAFFNRLSNEMHPFFVGPMPPKDFLDKFLCLPSEDLETLPRFEGPMFSSMTKAMQEGATKGKEEWVYDIFVWSNSYLLS